MHFNWTEMSIYCFSSGFILLKVSFQALIQIPTGPAYIRSKCPFIFSEL